MMINELSDFWIFKAIGAMVLNSLWAGGIMAIAFWLMWKFSQKLSASFRYKLLLGCLLIFAVSGVSFFFNAICSHYLALRENSIQTTAELYLYESQVKVPADVKNRVIPKIEINPYYINRYKTQIGVFWILGLLVLYIRFLGGYFYLRRIKNSGVKPLDLRFETTFEVLLKKTQIKQKVDLKESRLITSPLTIGFRYPVILVPHGMMATVPPAQLEAIFLHELYHIRNRDFLVHLLQSIIIIIFFYHPIVWWLSNKINAEREFRCDDHTIAFSKNPMALARALTFLKEYQFNLKNTLAMSILGKKSNLNYRIYRLFNPEKQISFKKLGFLSLGIIIITASAFNLIQVQEDKESATGYPFYQDIENTNDSSRILMSTDNIKIIVRGGKLQIDKIATASSEPLFVVDGKLVDLTEIEMLKASDIASVSLHNSEVVMEGVIAIHTNEFRDMRFRGFVKSAEENRTYKEPDIRKPISIYMIEGKEVSEEEFNNLPWGFTLEGISGEEAIVRYGEKGKDDVVIMNKRK